MSFSPPLGLYQQSRYQAAQTEVRLQPLASGFMVIDSHPEEPPRTLERVMNLAEKPHQDADSSVSSIHRQPPVFRIRKPFLSKFITRSRKRTAVYP
jgi:hypothetical protein